MVNRALPILILVSLIAACGSSKSSGPTTVSASCTVPAAAGEDGYCMDATFLSTNTSDATNLCTLSGGTFGSAPCDLTGLAATCSFSLDYNGSTVTLDQHYYSSALYLTNDQANCIGTWTVAP